VSNKELHFNSVSNKEFSLDFVTDSLLEIAMFVFMQIRTTRLCYRFYRECDSCAFPEMRRKVLAITYCFLESACR
jgi:hypothetical protein